MHSGLLLHCLNYTCNSFKNIVKIMRINNFTFASMKLWSQFIVAKLTASARLKPKLKPAWKVLLKVTTNSPGY